MNTALIILGLLLFSLLVTYKREWGIYLIVLLLPTYQIRFQILNIPATFLEGLILILAIVELFYLIKTNRLKEFFVNQIKKPVAQTILIGLFLLAATVSVFVAPDLEKAAGLWKAFFVEPIIFFYLMIQIINAPEKLQKLFKSFAWLVIYLSAFGIYQFFTLANLPFNWWAVDVASRRITSLVNHPNALALLIGPLLGMIIIYALTSSKVLKEKLFWTAGSLGLVSFILSFSRAGWLALAISVVFFGLFTKYKKLVVVVSLIIILLVLAIPFPREKILSLIDGKDLAQQNRIVLWTAAVDIIKNNPLLGVGLKGFREAYKDYPLGPDQVRQNYPHNFFINFWVELGLLGLIGILGLLILFYKKIWQLFKQNKSLALTIATGMTIVLLHGMVDVPYFKNDLTVLFWIILALPYLKMLR